MVSRITGAEPVSRLEVEDLQILYGKAQALHGVTLAVDSSEFAAIIGPNGAGKTTLLSAISGLIPYRGRIRFDGADLANHQPHQIVRKGLIHCPEGRNLFPYLSVRDNLMLGAFRRRDGTIARDLREVFELFPQLARRKGQMVHTLSGGEQQMVAIGRSLMSRPRLLLLDEPTLGLAPLVRAHISQALDEIRDRYHMSVLLAEQNADFAFQHADRILLMETGRIVREGAPESLREDAYIRQAYLGR